MLRTVLKQLFLKYRKYFPRKVKIKIKDFLYIIFGRKIVFPLLRFEVHLADNCNLKCAGCLHFSSLCWEDVRLDTKIYEKDCKRISELTNGKIIDIRLLGGEPLLHPDVNEFFAITRKYFPLNKSDSTGIIDLATNGILLHEQPDNFWESLKKHDIRIVISDYPIEIKTELIREKASKFNVEVKMISENIEFEESGSAKQWIKISIDVNGLQDYKKNFGKCSLAGISLQLVNGRIYKCPRIAYIDYFNTAFNKQLIVKENDYVDIYRVKDGSELLYLLTKPACFCRYCKVDDTTWKNEWKISKRQIEEWV